MRFGYGAIVPWVSRLENGALRAIAGPDMVTVHTPVHLRGEDMTTVGEFVINRDETIPFVLSYLPSHLPLDQPFDPMRALAETETFWRDWSAKCRPAGPWTDAVVRSMITLKALTYAPDRRHRGRSHDVAARSSSAAAATGTTAIAGCATPRWCCSALMHAGYFRGSAGLARMALARGRRQSRPVADHVRHRPASGG